MRTITKTVYNYDELSQTAKGKATVEFQSNIPYGWENENKETLKAFENIFPVKVGRWEYGYRSFINFEFTESQKIEELTGVRLATYIYNNYYRYLFKGKYYSTPIKWIDGKATYKKRYSKVIMTNDCVLTGYCLDFDILDPIYKFLKNPCQHTNFKDLMNECLESWVSACDRDYDGYYSEENIMDMCTANNYEFYEDGTMV